MRELGPTSKPEFAQALDSQRGCHAGCARENAGATTGTPANWLTEQLANRAPKGDCLRLPSASRILRRRETLDCGREPMVTLLAAGAESGRSTRAQQAKATRSSRQVPRSHYAKLAGVEVGDGFPTCVVGIINVSAESFYGASVARGRRALERRAAEMVREGAAILDIGAMSTAPYLQGAVSEREERRRMLAAVEVLKNSVGVPLSIDTQRSRVALAALEAGAQLVNDVSGLSYDPGMAAVVAHAQGAILMAAEVGPSTKSPLTLVGERLRIGLQKATASGVQLENVVLDPGIGFFRQGAVPWYEFDCAILRNLSRLRRLGRPLLVGISRKSFVGRICGRADASERLAGSLAAAAIAVGNGAALVRTHDVAATCDAVRMAEALRGAS